MAKRIFMLLAALAVLVIGCALPALADVPDSNYGPAAYKDSGGDRIVITDGGALWNDLGAGDIGVSSTGFSLTENGIALHQTTFTLDAIELVITDHTTAGAHGSLKLYDFPAGYIKFVGSSADLDVACGTVGLTATATYEIGVGTATLGVDNAALTSTEEDILTGVASDMSGSAIALGTALAVDASKDGHTTAADAYLNLVFAADDASADDVCTLDGTVTVTWVNLGDY